MCLGPLKQHMCRFGSDHFPVAAVFRLKPFRADGFENGAVPEPDSDESDTSGEFLPHDAYRQRVFRKKVSSTTTTTTTAATQSNSWMDLTAEGGSWAKPKQIATATASASAKTSTTTTTRRQQPRFRMARHQSAPEPRTGLLPDSVRIRLIF